jgi:hypothetical protein
MPKPKPFVALTQFAKSEDEAIREMAAGIDELLFVANVIQEPGEAEKEPKLAAEIELVLTELRKGTRMLYLPWPPLRARAYDNLANWCESGRVHLGRCPICNRWFLARDKRQQRCHRAECRAEAKRGLDRRNRQQETRRAAMARKGKKSS